MVGFLFSFGLLHAEENRMVALKAGYNAIQFNANVTFADMIEKIGVENLISIQGAGQGSSYKKENVDQGLDFLNSFQQTNFGQAYWVNVVSDVEFSYIAQTYGGTKTINLAGGWNFVGPIGILTISEIQAQLGMDNLLVIQGAGQGRSYKKSYVDDGLGFLNRFTAFEQGQGYWIKVVSDATLSFIFKSDATLSFINIAKDNTYHDVEKIVSINGAMYTVKLFTDGEPQTETSQSTIAVYGQVNGEMVVLPMNSTYLPDAQFQVQVFDGNENLVTMSILLNFNEIAIEFPDITIEK
jgi:hypothetical protein